MSMFVWSAATRIYLALGATDLPQGFDALYALVQQRLELAPLSGHVFVFANRRRSRIKLLFWDGKGRSRKKSPG
jgi:transposase